MSKEKINIFLKGLDSYFPNPVTELKYKKDYELLIAVMLSAQTTDKRVNIVTNRLFLKYDNLESLSEANEEDIKNIIKEIGTYNRKAKYIISIATDLVNKFDKKMPKVKSDLMTLDGVGRKTANVVTSILYNTPSIAVDTHVKRVSKRLGLVSKSDNEITIEKKLMRLIEKSKWSKVHHQMVLFGRYRCKALKPLCKDCLLRDICKEKDKY